MLNFFLLITNFQSRVLVHNLSTIVKKKKRVLQLSFSPFGHHNSEPSVYFNNRFCFRQKERLLPQLCWLRWNLTVLGIQVTRAWVRLHVFTIQLRACHIYFVIWYSQPGEAGCAHFIPFHIGGSETLCCPRVPQLVSDHAGFRNESS